eukprot:jgi/Chlat1/3114/Chrsp21S03345
MAATGPAVERQRFDQICAEFVSKSAHVIVHSRVPFLPPPISSSPRNKSNRWFNLETRELETLKPEVEPWRRFEEKGPLVLDILLQDNSVRDNSKRDGDGDWDADDGQFLLERWVIQQERTLGCVEQMEVPVVYKRTIIMLRTLYALTRTLPAHRLFRCCKRSRSPTFGLFYRIHSAPNPLTPNMCDGDKVGSFAFSPVDTPAGRLCLSVTYRHTTGILAVEASPAPLAAVITDYIGSPSPDPMRWLPSAMEDQQHGGSYRGLRTHTPPVPLRPGQAQRRHSWTDVPGQQQQRRPASGPNPALAGTSAPSHSSISYSASPSPRSASPMGRFPPPLLSSGPAEAACIQRTTSAPVSIPRPIPARQMWGEGPHAQDGTSGMTPPQNASLPPRTGSSLKRTSWSPSPPGAQPSTVPVGYYHGPSPGTSLQDMPHNANTLVRTNSRDAGQSTSSQGSTPRLSYSPPLPFAFTPRSSSSSFLIEGGETVSAVSSLTAPHKISPPLASTFHDHMPIRLPVMMMAAAADPAYEPLRLSNLPHQSQEQQQQQPLTPSPHAIVPPVSSGGSAFSETPRMLVGPLDYKEPTSATEADDDTHDFPFVVDTDSHDGSQPATPGQEDSCTVSADTAMGSLVRMFKAAPPLRPSPTESHDSTDAQQSMRQPLQHQQLPQLLLQQPMQEPLRLGAVLDSLHKFRAISALLERSHAPPPTTTAAC